MQRANASDVDYLGVGSVYRHALERRRRRADRRRRPAPARARAAPPVAAIGGIDLARLAEVRATGVAMAAVISAVANATDPARAARELVARWEGGDAMTIVLSIGTSHPWNVAGVGRDLIVGERLMCASSRRSPA